MLLICSYHTHTLANKTAKSALTMNRIRSKIHVTHDIETNSRAGGLELIITNNEIIYRWKRYLATIYPTSCGHNWLADDDKISFIPSGGTRRQDAPWSRMLLPTLAGRTAAISLVMFLFRPSRVLSIFKHPVLRQTPQEEVKSGDRGGWSPVEVILSPEEILDFFRGPVRYATRQLISSSVNTR